MAEKTVAPVWKPLAVEHGYYNPLMVGSIDGTDDRPHDRAISRAISSSCQFKHSERLTKNPFAC